MDHETFTDMASPRTQLDKLGVQHGDMVFMHYPFERAVAPSVHRSAFEARPFGADPGPPASALPVGQQNASPLTEHSLHAGWSA